MIGSLSWGFAWECNCSRAAVKKDNYQGWDGWKQKQSNLILRIRLPGYAYHIWAGMKLKQEPNIRFWRIWAKSHAFTSSIRTMCNAHARKMCWQLLSMEPAFTRWWDRETYWERN